MPERVGFAFCARKVIQERIGGEGGWDEFGEDGWAIGKICRAGCCCVGECLAGSGSCRLWPGLRLKGDVLGGGTRPGDDRS
jgi:hypothetical protein